MVPEISPKQILEDYDFVILDAYGVLVTDSGAIAGAAAFLEALHASDCDWAIVTNDASRLPETSSQAYRDRGIEVEPERIITAGSLLSRYVQEQGLEGATACVLGPEDSNEYARRAGLEVVQPGLDVPCDVFVLGSQSFDFLPGVETALSMMISRIESGHEVRLVVPNPDCIYPKGGGVYGIAAGSVAAMFETALAAKFPGQPFEFARLGKPNAPIFSEALRRANGRRTVMVGDQLLTDIRGANGVGIDSVLFTSGIADSASIAASGIKPTYLMRSLSLVY